VRSNQRLKKLERIEKARGGGPPCPECEARGLYTEGEPTYELLFDDDLLDRGEDIPSASVYCGTCGELVFGVIEFGDETPADDAGMG
jgi:hypothetical protein